MGTRHPAADFVLEDIAASIHTVLGGDLVAIYLYGSYVSGGFDPGVSDLDLVAVTSAEVEEIDLAGLEQMHDDLISRHPEWDDRIEVVYVGRVTLEAFRTSHGRLAVISPGEPFHVREDRAAEWVQNWYLARETGIALHGPSAAAVVPSVEWPEFVAAAVQYADQLSGRSLREVTPGHIAYSVLTMCRAVMTVRTQTLASKQDAAAWARRTFPAWAWVVDAALECRRSGGTVGFAIWNPCGRRRVHRAACDRDRETASQATVTPRPGRPALASGYQGCRGRYLVGGHHLLVGIGDDRPSGSWIGGSSDSPVMSRVPRPWVRKLPAQRTTTTIRFAKPIRYAMWMPSQRAQAGIRSAARMAPSRRRR